MAANASLLSDGVGIPSRPLAYAICAPRYPLTLSVAIKSIKMSSLTLINRPRGEGGELWQGRFFDRALRTVGECHEKVEYLHFNPVKAGLVGRAQDWRWSSVNEYSGKSAAEQEEGCGPRIDRVHTPSDTQTRI
jgi:putative transposase